MIRAEMLDRMSSQELTGWQALFHVKHEEASDAHLRATSQDGEVVISGRDDDDDDDDETDDDDQDDEPSNDTPEGESG